MYNRLYGYLSGTFITTTPMKLNKTAKKEQFEEVLKKYIFQKLQIQASNVFEIIQQQNKHVLKGIWEFVAEQTSISAKQAHDYFHNTYKLQFYTPVTAYQRQLQQFTQLNLEKENRQIAAEFMALTKLDFCQRQLLQIISKSRVKSRAAEKSVSVKSIDSKDKSSISKTLEDESYSLNMSILDEIQL